MRRLIGFGAALLLGAAALGQEQRLDQGDVSEPRMIPGVVRQQFDEAQAAQLGIRKLSGQRLTLYTDLPPGPEVDLLPQVFDQAFPQWCEFFAVKADALAAWRMTGFLMRDKARFQRAQMLSDDLPPFPNGFARNDELWLYEQPSDYYRRHLLLHEGTHGFMNTVLGGCGPTWYMEGLAELLGTHRWRDGKLTLNYLPAARDELPIWGRIKVIQDAVAQRRAKTLPEVLAVEPRDHRAVEAYAWSWAAATLLERHPRYHDRFRQLARYVLQPDFNRQVQELYAADWQALCEEWQVLVVDLQYGHDIARTAIDFIPGVDLPAAGARVTVAVDRGWQSSRVRLQSGVAYHLKGSGRYQLASSPQPWWCEPNGVSIHYHRGRPLGLLLAAVRPDDPSAERSSALLRPIAVGLDAVIRPAATGTLYLQINDSPADLADNAGPLSVEIRPE